MQWRWLIPVLAIAAAVLSPVFGLLWFAAKGSGDLWPHLIQNVLPTATRTTIILLLGVGVVVTVIGVGTAWLIATYRFPGRRFLEWALLLPLAVPTYVIAYAYLDVMHPVGPVQTFLRHILGITNPRDLWFPEVRSMGGAIFLLGLVLFPYVYLPVRALFLMQSATFLEASRTLGAGPFSTFVRIALPLARPAVVVGLTLSLLEALNDIGASEFLGIRTMTVSIYTTWVTRNSIEGAAQIALVMMVIILGLLMLERWARRRQRYVGGGQRSHPPALKPIHGWRAAAAIIACAAPPFFGFGVPALYLIYAAATRIAEFGWPPEIGGWIASTVTLAAIATVATVAVGLFLAYAARVLKRRVGNIAMRLATIGYALPGNGVGRRPADSRGVARQLDQRPARSMVRHFRRPDHSGFRRRTHLRLCAAVPADRCRQRRIRLRQDQPFARHGGAQPWRRPVGDGGAGASADPPSGAGGRRADRLCRLHEGTAGHPPPAPVWRGDAVDAALRRGPARNL